MPGNAPVFPSPELRAVPPLSTLIDRTAADAACRGACETFRAEVSRKIAEAGLVRRPTSLEELKADPVFPMKYREKPAHRPDLDDAAWRRFALSLGDCERNRLLADLLPAAAAAVRLGNDDAVLDFLRAQLAEISSWAPLMRPGWSGGAAADGAWLGTAWAARAIFWTLAVLPEDALEPALVAALETRLREELRAVREDWRERRGWFVRQEAVYSNQWALPLEAMVLACARLGVDEHRDDYEFAIAGLLRTLDAQGAKGEFVEGMEYGAITLHALHSAARAAAESGDPRLLAHPFLRAFPLWYLHHRQPAGQTINAFDNRDTDLDFELLARAVADTSHPEAAWVLARRPASPAGVFSLAALPLLADLARRPPLFAHYPVATRVNWLEDVAAYDPGPAHNVSGFWMRGGHASDAHDHQDRGHVNFIVRGRPVLIEAGHASYGAPEHATHFRSVAGHNVLQIGPHSPEALTREILTAGAGQILDPSHRAAPIKVRRLDTLGGSVEMDGSRCYAGLVRWIRRVEWDAVAVTIIDEVELPSPDIVLFRWHLGSTLDAPSEVSANVARVGGIVISCELQEPRDAALALALEPMPDRTLLSDRVASHPTLVARSAAPVLSAVFKTRVSLDS